jgi:AAA domain
MSADHVSEQAFEDAFSEVWEPKDSTTEQGEAAAEQGEQPDLYPFTLLRDVQIDLDSKFVIKDLIPYAALGEIYAPPGGGKTAIGVDMGLHIASGRIYRGRRTEQQPVVYIALEGHSGINNRVAAARQHLGLDDQDIAFALVKIRADFRVAATAQKVAATVKALVEQFGGNNPVIYADTFQAALGPGGSDCDPKDVTALIENVKDSLISTGCTVIVVHHTGKDASKGSRGWSGLLGALDFELEIDRKKDARFMYVGKERDTADEQAAMCYRLLPHVLGVNEYDEPVTAVVVEHMKDAEGTNTGNKLTSIEQATLNVLWKLIKDPLSSWPMPDQPGLKCTMMGVWKKASIVEGAICKCKNERDRAARFKAAAAVLIEKGLVIADGQDNERVHPALRDQPDGDGDDAQE